MSLDGTTEQEGLELNTSSYEEMTVEELKVLCKEKGIEGYSSLKKADLIEILKVTE